MYVKTVPTRSIRNSLLIAAITLLFFISIFSFVHADNNAPQSTAEVPFSTFTFTLTPNQETPVSIFNSGSKNINFSLAITGTSTASMADLTVFNASNTNIWSGSAMDAELLWGNTTLTNGNNTFKVKNSGPDSLTLTLKLFNIPNIQAPTPTYSWVGSAAPAGNHSEIDIYFPVSGLYTFDFSVNSGERYEFLLGTNDIQRTVTSDGIVSLYVEAGVQTVEIIQDTTGNLVDWQVDMAYSGITADPLPYTKSNDDIDSEQMPIHLSAPAQVNMVITATGTVGDQLLVNIVGANPQLATVTDANVSVYAGETTWTTFNLPAGTSSIELTTPTGVMSYEFEISVLPTADYAYTGIADSDGQNSKIRLTFDTAGLYDFEFGNNGRYQFQLKVDDNNYIQKTVEGTSIVTYYVPEGTHDLIIDQDSSVGAEWAVDISLNAATNNSLPYAKMGGDMGGTGNDFKVEWLPISLANASNVNLSINADGDTTDSFAVEVYESGSNVADFTLSQVLGSEDQWANFQLSAGINRLKIIAANSNTSDLTYDLEISAVPTNGTMAWNGNVLDTGLNPTVQVNFPTTGLYRFDIESSTGFANLMLDDHMPALLAPLASPPDLGTSYDVQVEAGLHEIYVMQDVLYSNTTWTASVSPSTAEPKFFEFTGTLGSGEIVTPVYPVPVGTLDFNFSLEVSGNDVSLAIVDGDSNTVWSGSALDGETIWGTGTLSGSNELTLTNGVGSATDVILTLYHIPDAGYIWDGLADSNNAVNSEIRVNFPSAGLYTFDLNAVSGRYQFLLDDNYIQKTVETSNTDMVAYFVPAGMQSIKIVQDTNPGNTDWDLDISDVGAAHNSLPYTKMGGDIGGAGNDFDREWLPIDLSAATAVNIATTIIGSGSDSVDVKMLNSSDAVLGTVTVNAGETTWITLDLPAGTSRLQVEANGNTATAEYDIMVAAIPSAASFTWDGNAIDIGENSHIRVSFPNSGIYTFMYGVDSGNGRYQFLLNDNYVQKTVEADGSVAYYISAGMHDLYLDQDSTDGADWSLAVSGATAAQDSLPYTKMGGELGGSGNDFAEEWLPAYVGTDTAVNAVITITGAEADAVSIDVWDTMTKTETVQPIYGTESVWATFTLPANGRLNIMADGGNNSEISYEITIIDIPAPTFTWGGTSLAGTLNSTVEIDLPASGLYHITGNYPVGFASLIIDPTQVNAPFSPNADFNMDVNLDAGVHTFVVAQGASFPTSTWVYTLTLVSADAPTITSVTPNTINKGTATTITVNGTNFLDGAVVKLIGDTNYTLVTTYVSGTQVTAVVPATVDIDLYDVQIVNPDAKSATLANALEVLQYYIYLPVIMK